MIESWKLVGVSNKLVSSSLYSFNHTKRHWNITVFAKSEREAWVKLASRIEREKEALLLKRVSMKDSIDDWIDIDI